VTVEAIVGDEELASGMNRILAAFIGILYHDRFDGERKPGGKIVIVLHEPQTVTRHH
jgi:hypothetical protein